jgi:hypothetical protein
MSLRFAPSVRQKASLTNFSILLKFSQIACLKLRRCELILLENLMRKMFQKWPIVKGWKDFLIVTGFISLPQSQDFSEIITLPL